jgi:hypothetical protein
MTCKYQQNKLFGISDWFAKTLKNDMDNVRVQIHIIRPIDFLN